MLYPAKIRSTIFSVVRPNGRRTSVVFLEGERLKDNKGIIEESVNENVKADVKEEIKDKDTDLVDISEEIKKAGPEGDDKTSGKSEADRTFQLKKKKKWLKWLIIIVIILAVVGFIIFRAVQAANKLKEAFDNPDQEAEIKRMDISSTISTTGTIQSKDIRTLTSPLSGVKIDEVNYKVGDMVEQGAVVVTFSREDINKKIGQLDEDIDEAKQTKALDAGDRANTYASSYGTESYNLTNSYLSVDRTSQDLDKARTDLNDAYDKKSNYLNDYNEAKANIDSAKADLEAATVEYDLWKTAGHPDIITKTEAEGGLTPDDTLHNARELDMDYNLSTRISDLKTKVNEYESTIKNYDTSIDSYNKTITSAQNSLDTAQRNYDDAVNKSNKADYDSYYNSAKYDYTYNKGNVTADDNIKSLERQKEERVDSLDNYIVTAPISGLVTTVNAQEGNGYQATTGALMTIQAIDVLEVTTQVDEYDINNVVLGQKVAIMTDATGEDELDGRVTFIAPIATTAQGNATASASNTSNTFEVKIDILNKDSRLRLGMSTKLNFLVDVHKDVLAVPYDAIEEKEGGAHYIYVVDKAAAEAAEKKKDGGIDVIGLDGLLKGDKDDSDDDVAFGDEDPDKKKKELPKKPPGTKEIPVQIGLEGDYYTEVISPDISEGMTVLVNSTAGELQSDFEMMMGGGRD